MYVWRMTDQIEADVQRIEQLRVTLDRGTLPRRWAGRLRRELQAESTAASTALEGVPVTVEEVRRILAGDRPSSVSEDDARLVEGYRDAMSFVLRRADAPGFSWQAELFLGIQDRVLAGSYSNGAGRFRSGPVYVAGDQGTIYEPPAADLVPELVAELAAFVQEQAGDIAPPVMAALVHVGLAGIHPFRDGNGRTARVLASLAMYRGGFTRPQFTSLEEWWGSHRSEYYDAFGCLGASWNPKADVTPFVTAHVRAHCLQVDVLSLREDTERVLWSLIEDIATEELGVAPRAADALFDAFFSRKVTNRYYRTLSDVSVATATNDLAKLDASGLLVAKGAGRTRSYTGSEKLMAAISREAGLEGLPIDAPVEVQRQWIMVRLAQRIHGE